MKHTTIPFARKLLLTVLLASFSVQALATTYTYRKYIPGLKETLSTLAARTVPFIDHILPAGGDTAGGNTIAIYATPDGLNPLTGHGFAPGTTVAVDGVLASSSLQGVVSPGMGASLNVLMPYHAVGTAQVVVTDPRGTTVSAPYAYTHSVTVSAVTPASGLVAGAPLTIYGTGFVSGSQVSIDGVPAQLTAAYSTQLVATAPAHAQGSATLTVTNPDTSHFTFSGLSYGAPATASFSTASLNAGPVTVGQSVQVTPVTVSNPGDFVLSYSALSAPPGGWSLAAGAGACNSAGGSIPAHGSCTLTYTFAPTLLSQGGGTVVFTPTTAGITATSLSLTGTAVAPAGPILPPAGSVFATLNPNDKASAITLTNGNRTAGYTQGNGWFSVNATQSLSSGKWYWEITSEGGNPNVLAGAAMGLTTSSITAYGMSGGGAAVYNSAGGTIAYGSGAWATTVGGTLGVALDMDAKKVTYYINGISQGVAPITLPATVVPYVTLYWGTLTANFGSSTPSFKYPVPSGYHAGVFH